MQRLPLGWFSRTKAGQIIARILTDTEQAKAILAEVATRSIQNLAQVVVTVAVLFGSRRASRSGRSWSRR